MISNVRTLDRRLLVRRCVQCGYDGAALNDERLATEHEQHQCPRCQCDLHARPPRSYAEMEGLLEPSLPYTPRAPRKGNHAAPERTQRLVHRWMAFLFIALVGMLAIAYLAAAVMST